VNEYHKLLHTKGKSLIIMINDTKASDTQADLEVRQTNA